MASLLQYKKIRIFDGPANLRVLLASYKPLCNRAVSSGYDRNLD
jgi:hypothetical protein